MTENSISIFEELEKNLEKIPQTGFLEIDDKGKTKILKMEVIKYLLNKHHAIVIPNKKYMYLYNKDLGIYEIDYGDKIKTELYEIFGDLLSPGIMITLIDMAFHIKEFHPETEIENTWINSNFICFRNGVYDIEKQILLPHSPTFYFLSRIPHDYNKTARCPNIEKLMKNVFITKGKCETLEDELEWVAYLLIPTQKYKTFTIYTGNYNSGKSTYLKVITEFLGQKNVSNVEPQDLTKEFYLADIIGKMANITGDSGSGKINNFHKIKQLTGGDKIMANIKGKPMIDFYNTAKIMFACNNIPRFDDNSDSTFTRLRLVQCFNKISRDDIKDFNIEEYITEEEMEGLANLALTGLNRLIKRGGFNKRNIEDVAEEHDLLANIIYRFAEDCIEFEDPIFHGTFKVSTKVLHNRYLSWCKEKDIPGDKPLKSFIREFKGKFFDKHLVHRQMQIDGTYTQGFDGIKIIGDEI